MNKKLDNNLKQHIGYWLNRLRSCVNQRFEERLAAYNISIASWCIMVAIYDKRANSINELAHYIESDKATISRVAGKLAKKGFLLHKEGKDKRSGIIELTSKGKNIVPKLIREAEQNEQQFFGYLTKIEKEQLNHIMRTIIENIPNITIDGWLLNNIQTEKKMKIIEQILEKAKTNKEPYPKTFEALKSAGVKSYSVYFADQYKAIYEGTFGSWQEAPPHGYHPSEISKEFKGEGVKAAIINHMQKKTKFVEFLSDIAASGVSHYKVDMDKRTVTYFNKNESKFHQENVPSPKV